MVKNTLNAALLRGIELYTGRTVSEIKVHHDPIVTGTYAIRATIPSHPSGPTVDFLIVGNQMEKSITSSTSEEISDHLEEIECGVWPPSTGRPRFFT
jgi:hypothetical protein